MKGRWALVGALLLAACADRAFVELPDNVRWVAVVQGGRASPLVSVDEGVTGYVRPSAAADLLGYASTDLGPLEPAVDPDEPLTAAASCPRLPAPSWRRRLEADGALGPSATTVPLTARWLGRACGDVTAEQIALELRCADPTYGCVSDVLARGGCAFEVRFRQACGFSPLTISLAGEQAVCAIGDGWRCETGDDGVRSCDVDRPTGQTICNVDVTVVDPPFTVERAAVRPDAAALDFGPVSESLFMTRSGLFADGVTQGIAVANDRIMVSALDDSSPGAPSTNDACWRRSTSNVVSRFHILDAETLAPVTTVAHDGCFRGFAVTPSGARAVRRHPNRLVRVATFSRDFLELTQPPAANAFDGRNDPRMVGIASFLARPVRGVALMFKSDSEANADQALAVFDLATGALTSSVSDFSDVGILNDKMTTLAVRPDGELLAAAGGIGVCRLGSIDNLRTECETVAEIVRALEAAFLAPMDLFFTDLLVLPSPERWIFVGGSRQDRAIVIHHVGEQRTTIVPALGRDLYPVRLIEWPAPDGPAVLITGFRVAPAPGSGALARQGGRCRAGPDARALGARGVLTRPRLRRRAPIRRRGPDSGHPPPRGRASSGLRPRRAEQPLRARRPTCAAPAQIRPRRNGRAGGTRDA